MPPRGVGEDRPEVSGDGREPRPHRRDGAELALREPRNAEEREVEEGDEHRLGGVGPEIPELGGRTRREGGEGEGEGAARVRARLGSSRGVDGDVDVIAVCRRGSTLASIHYFPFLFSLSLFVLLFLFVLCSSNSLSCSLFHSAEESEREKTHRKRASVSILSQREKNGFYIEIPLFFSV